MAREDAAYVEVARCHRFPWLERCRDVSPATLPPKPQPALTPEPECATVVCVVDAVIREQGMEWATDVWHCIIKHESGWDPNAVGAAGERGLIQAHPIWASRFDWSRMFDPAYNMAAGITIYELQGWRAWSVHARCGV